MCEPSAMFGVSLALAAAQNVAQHQSAATQARQQAEYQRLQAEAHNKAAQQNAQNAIREQTEQTTAERQKQMQENAAAARDKQAIQKDFLQRRGEAIASSPNAAGAAFDALMADYERVYAFNNDVVDEQLAMSGAAADTNIRAYRDQADSRINSYQGYIGAPVFSPNTLTSLLGFGGSALGAYNSYTNYGKDSIFRGYAADK